MGDYLVVIVYSEDLFVHRLFEEFAAFVFEAGTHHLPGLFLPAVQREVRGHGHPLGAGQERGQVGVVPQQGLDLAHSQAGGIEVITQMKESKLDQHLFLFLLCGQFDWSDRPDDLRPLPFFCVIKRGMPVTIGNIDLRPQFDQQLTDLPVPLLRSVEDGSPSEDILRVHVDQVSE